MSSIISWLSGALSTIGTWLMGKVGSAILSFAVTFLEGKFPGLTPIINQIMTWLGMGVPASQIATHLLNARFTIEAPKV